MTDSTPQAERKRPSAKHWAWFAGILTALLLLGFVVAFVMMLPLAMATDGCHEGTTDKICQLTARGQNVLVFIPWMCLAAGFATAVVGAGVAERLRRSPLFGLATGIVGYCAMIPIGYAIAFSV
ncbi:hypothetical protein [Mycolicibacterium mageritense]|uniref:Uncharacterized protein n=1 Tax=Mycolicibacterium mageritense TaxID=53462 RepID=A0AAI8TVU5_MYCME|nr:hypothetical protein [Mycolicibacterium mageritense]TXI63756.1 MAG: hypothetical protein E6Q55_08360 [Mycolicibacterium mageritense]BDY29791.1 hypothetical protein hbim_03731 [Mycolicibacterium mageritense]